jgi:photosystem II stability/assembly factor-like uncharacterized protein
LFFVARLFFRILLFQTIKKMRKSIGLLAVNLFLLIGATAQKVSLDRFKNMMARSIGPAGMSGRVTSIDVIHNNPSYILLGTASGGVWKTENSGTTWQSVFDDQPTLNIGAVAITQSNPAIQWVGTGEGNPRNSLNIGEGIYKTIDGGKTWKRMGLEKTRNIHRILIDPNNPDVVYAAAIGNPYAEHPERGVYKTTDGGETWKRILYTNDSSGCADLVIDPSNPNKLMAAMWQHRRTPWSFMSGGSGSGLYVTMDAGKAWKKLGKAEGLPDGHFGRIGLAIAPSQPNRIYALVEATKNGFYRTDDGGGKWELVNSDPSVVNNRPFYFQDIRVDSKNENRVYNVYQMISLSEDGGKSFRVIIPYNGIHPDHHAFWIHPTDPNLIIDGNDGGIGISRDRGASWKFDEQLPVGQFYHINVDNEQPYHVMGGMQDNGSWRGPAYTWINGGIRNYYWESLSGGDGFDVAADPEDANWTYSMSQGGELVRHNNTTGEDWRIQPPAPNLSTRLRYNWNAALALDPFDNKTIYYGSQFVHKSNNKGLSWSIISPDLTTNDTVKQNQANNGGLSIDITGAENYTTILCIEPSVRDRNVLWVGTDDGNVQLTRDGGKTWTNFRGKIPGMPIGAWIPQIRAGRHNTGEAFVVCNDYRRGDFKPYIFRTQDYGATWQALADENKVKGYALCVLQDPVEPNLIFAGTENGLWVSLDNGASFQQWKNGYPPVSTYDMVLQEREADLCIATFGRAIYVLDNIRPLRKFAANKGVEPAQRLTVFESPTAYQVNYNNAPGYEWSTWGLFEGQNRNRGAVYTFYVKPVTDTAKTKTDSATVKIYTETNTLIRTTKVKADSGFNKATWSFEMKGIRQPGSPRPGKNAPEPRGLSVYPGTYKLVLTLGKDSDSTMLTVKGDPRTANDKAVYDAKMKMMDRVNSNTEKLTAITDAISDAEETIKKIEAQLKDVEGKEPDSLRKTSKAMTDSLKDIRHFVFGKPQEKQGYGNVPQITPIRQLNELRGEILGKYKIPDAQEERLLTDVETLVNAAVKKATNFFTGRWKAFQQQVEATPVKLFKEVKL